MAAARSLPASGILQSGLHRRESSPPLSACVRDDGPCTREVVPASSIAIATGRRIAARHPKPFPEQTFRRQFAAKLADLEVRTLRMHAPSVRQFRKRGHVLAARRARDFQHSSEVHRDFPKDVAKASSNRLLSIANQCMIRNEPDGKTPDRVLHNLELFHLGAVPHRGREVPWRDQLAIAKPKQIHPATDDLADQWKSS